MLLIPPLIKKEETFFNFSNLINVCLPPTVLFNRLIILKSHSPILNKSYVNSHRVHRGRIEQRIEKERERGARRINEENDESRCNREIDGRAAPVSVSSPMKNENVRIHNNGIHKAAITKTYTAPLCVFYGGE